MRRGFVMLFILSASVSLTAPTGNRSDLRTVLDEELPMLGHRNWVVIVDSASPLQSSPGVETLETAAPQVEVLRHVLASIDRTVHLRPDVFRDAELSYVSEEDASGVSAYRRELQAVLGNYAVES